MTTHGREPRDLSATLARVVKQLAEVVELAADALLPEGVRGTPAGMLDPDVIVEVTHLHSRPSRAGEPQRLELFCLQRGPMPAIPFSVWATLPPGTAIEVGEQYDVLLRRRA